MFTRDTLKGVPSNVVARFNKVLGNESRNFRTAMGEVIAKQAGTGLLMSGHTIRLCLAEVERCLEKGVEDCLQLVANRTKHNGSQRRAMLVVLEDVTRHHANHMAKMIEERFARIEAFQGSAAVAREFEFHELLERRVDQIHAFADGLSAPPDKPWVERHPLLAVAASAAITLIVGSAIGVFGPVGERFLSLVGLK